MKEESDKMLFGWCKALEVLSMHYRLLLSANESASLLKIYEGIVQKLGQDECHAYMRPLSFDFAVKQTGKLKLPLTFQQLLDDESNLDRYTPSQGVLDIMELDEKHSSMFTFRNQEGLVNILTGNNIDKLIVTFMVQIIAKHLLMSAILTVDNCLNIIRSEIAENNELSEVSNEQLNQVSLVALAKKSSFHGSSAVSKGNVVKDLMFKKLFNCFISLQPEKSFYRDKMINQYLLLKEKKQANNFEEINQLKRSCIKDYCHQISTRLSQHAFRAQIIGEIYSFRELLRSFPVTRDAHFILGTEEEGHQKEKRFDFSPVLGDIRKRPRKFISTDGKLLNLWYIPHHTEIMNFGKHLQNENCNAALHLILRLMTSLHEITQYLCAHARCGSSFARMGTQTIEYNGITADWGGTEGIGAELRDIQKQIDSFSDPSDSSQVALFLEEKRDLMYMHYKVAVDISAKETFLEAQNMKAFNMVNDVAQDVFSGLNNEPKIWSHFLYPLIPDVVAQNDIKLGKWFPWQYFYSRYGYMKNGSWCNHSITHFVNLPIAGLNEMDRHIVHGEILGESLIIEDIMNTGEPNLNMFDVSTEKVDHSKKQEESDDRKTSTNVSTFSFSWHQNPFETAILLTKFLTLCCQLENLKRFWVPLRMNISSITSLKSYESFKHIYHSEITQAVLTHFSEKLNLDLVTSFKELPPSITIYEFKLKETARLIENFYCLTISETISKVSRDHAFLLNEKNHVEDNVPTGIWKTPAIKTESFNFPRDKSLEDFVSEFITDNPNPKTVSMNVENFEKCIRNLGMNLSKREKEMFLNYSSFYENLLRQKNKVIFSKEQEIRSLQSTIEDMNSNLSIDVDCQLAERTHDLLIEVSSLRTKLKEYKQNKLSEDGKIKEHYKTVYNDLVLDLFNSTYSMKERFDRYRFSLYDDTKDYLDQVRKLSSEKFKSVHQKNFADDTTVVSHRLIQSQKLRDLQRENSDLQLTLSKLRHLSFWNRVSSNSKFKSKVSSLEKDASDQKREFLEKSILQKEKESLQKEEQDALRKLITSLEKESENLKKQLHKEQKLKAQQSHTLLKEVQSLKHLDFAKTSNVEKITAELEIKEKELEIIKSSSSHISKNVSQSSSQIKRMLNQTMQQVEHERTLKLSAFERVDELQKQVNELEMKVLSLLQKDQMKCHHDNCFPVVPGGRTSPAKLTMFSLPKKSEVVKRPMTSFVQRPKSGISAKHHRPQSVNPKIRTIKSEIPISSQIGLKGYFQK